ncbi:MAG: hypothetical protein E7606_01465 [Ruminococcaceae bacterium]|nr:hypothetical protein [Oscillospiraceae bacterium]
MEKRYFASANGSEGFVNYFPKVFGACRRLYVILGGPGTGKSRFLREVAAKGGEVEYYHCSSDAASLDGVLLDGEIGLIDGTAPHVWRFTSIGTFEQVVDLGAFWDPRLLAANRADIDALSAAKRACYDEAYAYLRAIGEAERGITERLLDALDREKLRRAASRLLRGVVADGKGARKIGLCAALGMRGEAHFDTYEQAKTTTAISDGMGTAWLLFHELDAICRARGISTRVSPTPLFAERLDAMELTEQGISFFVSESEDAISMKKFFRADKMRALRPALRATRATQERLKDLALEALSRAATAHFALEDIYAAAMDFTAKEQFTAEFCQKLFG